MFALVESGSITKLLNGTTGITIDGVQHPRAIFTVWTEAERNAIGIYTVEMDKSKLKSDEWYINTDITYSFGSNKVTGSYGDATARAHADTKWTQSEIDAGKAPAGADTNTVAVKGLKTIKKELIDSHCAGILAPSDWMVVKATETGTTMDSGWKTWRASVRTKCNSMQTQIDNAADIDALAALFTYTEQSDKSYTRPLGQFPVKE